MQIAGMIFQTRSSAVSG
ncbi:MAG: DUF6783 domain-containing protein [Blautia wexlerae]